FKPLLEQYDLKQLDIRISGTTTGWQQVPRFIVAKAPSPSNDWYLRVEEPRLLHSLSERLSDREKALPAATIFRRSAKQKALPLVRAFDELFAAVDHRTPVMN